MTSKQHSFDGGQGGWFGEPRRHAEATKKGQQRETHAPAQHRQRPKEIGGIPVPTSVPADAEMTFVGTKEELIEEAKKYPDREKMATPMYGVYVLWTKER